MKIIIIGQTVFAAHFPQVIQISTQNIAMYGSRRSVNDVIVSTFSLFVSPAQVCIVQYTYLYFYRLLLAV